MVTKPARFLVIVSVLAIGATAWQVLRPPRVLADMPIQSVLPGMSREGTWPVGKGPDPDALDRALRPIADDVGSVDYDAGYGNLYRLGPYEVEVTKLMPGTTFVSVRRAWWPLW